MLYCEVSLRECYERQLPVKCVYILKDVFSHAHNFCSDLRIGYGPTFSELFSRSPSIDASCKFVSVMV